MRSLKRAVKCLRKIGIYRDGKRADGERLDAQRCSKPRFAGSNPVVSSLKEGIMTDKYYLALQVPFDEEPNWEEVSFERFRIAEVAAGFRNKGGGNTATAGFIGNGVMGRVIYAPLGLT